MKEKQLAIVDHNLMDIIDHGSTEFPIQYYVDELASYPLRTIPLHWHTEVEFYMANGGPVRVQIGKTFFRLDDGEAIFINTNVLHAFTQIEENTNCQCPNIVFSYELLASSGSVVYQKYIQGILQDATLPYFIIHKKYSWQKDILDLLDMIFSILQKYGKIPDYYGQYPLLPYQNKDYTSPCFEIDIQIYLQQIWKLLYLHADDIPRTSFVQNKHTLQIRIQKMLLFIHEYYASPIHLSDIAHAAGISKSEASRCFHSYLHDSPVNYLLKYRIDQAKHLLKSGDATTVETSALCGFQSSSYFCRIFHKETGYTPSQYRKTT